MEICVKHLVEINNNSCSVPKQKDGNVCATPGGDSGERGQRHFVANDLNLWQLLVLVIVLLSKWQRQWLFMVPTAREKE